LAEQGSNGAGTANLVPPSISRHRTGDGRAYTLVNRGDDAPLSILAPRSASHVVVPRGATSILVERQQFAHTLLGQSFYDTTTGQYLRNVYVQLGYIPPRLLKFPLLFARYERGGIAERIVDAYPQATWSGGARIVEDPDPTTETPFEAAVRELFTRLQLWSRLTRVDTLAGIGEYAVLLIGAPDPLDTELPKNLRANEVRYIKPFHQGNATVAEWDKNPDSERFGQPTLYSVRFQTSPTTSEQKNVHWSRVIHVADGLLESDLFGKPRLRAVWNYLDDLEKNVGGGSEAAWKRMDPGLHVDVDPEMPFSPAEQAALSDEMDEMQHGLRRYMRTRGTTVTPLVATVTGFGPNADTVLKLIAATTGIPLRILLGSERGELASTQDRLNWADRILERRRQFATPLVRTLLGRLMERGAIPTPSATTLSEGKGATPVSDLGADYIIMWPNVGELDDVAKADLIGKLAAANQAMYISGMPPVMSSEEIRREFLHLGPMKEEDIPPSKAELEREKQEFNAKMMREKATLLPKPTGPPKDTPSPSGEGGPDA
jgi:hypothetical protein